MTVVEILDASASRDRRATAAACTSRRTRVPQITSCVERMDRARRRHLAALATAQRLLPAAQAPSGPAVIGRAVAGSGATAGCDAIGAGCDGRVVADEDAREPETMPMFAGLEGVAGPAVEAPEQQDRRYRAAI